MALYISRPLVSTLFQGMRLRLFPTLISEPAEGQYDGTTMDGTISIAKQTGVSDFVFAFGEVPP